MYDLNTAKTKVNDYTQNKWSRTLDDTQFGQLGEALNYQGGTIDDNFLNQAYGEVDKYAQSQGWNGPPPPGPAPVPTDPTGAVPPGPAPVPPDETGAVPPGPAPVPPEPSPSPSPSPLPPQPSADLSGILGPNTSQPSNLQQSAQDALMALLTRSQQAATINDPNLQPVADAYRSRRQRGYERERNALAEMAAANGTINSGGFETDAMGALQGANRDTAQFESGLVHDELSRRRAELLAGIEQAAQMGDSQAARDLQRQLALTDATLRQQQIDLNRTLGTGELDLRRALGFSDLDLRGRGLDLNRELGRGDLDLRGRSLAQQGALGRGDLALRLLGTLMQNDQYYSGLGLNAAQMQALLNQNAVTQLLGGF